MAMFSIGSSMTHAAQFLRDRNMPAITVNYLNDTKSMINYVTIDIANNSMMKARNDRNDSSGNNVTMSCDGMWQKGGFLFFKWCTTVLSVPNQVLLKL